MTEYLNFQGNIQEGSSCSLSVYLCILNVRIPMPLGVQKTSYSSLVDDRILENARNSDIPLAVQLVCMYFYKEFYSATPDTAWRAVLWITIIFHLRGDCIWDTNKSILEVRAALPERGGLGLLIYRIGWKVLHQSAIIQLMIIQCIVELSHLLNNIICQRRSIIFLSATSSMGIKMQGSLHFPSINTCNIYLC